MADRYWVGGAGTWNTTSTTNWSASSGGPNGASVPTSADSVFFDQAGTYTVTMTGTTLTCLNWTISAGAVTLSVVSPSAMNISGGVTWAAGAVTVSGGFSGPLDFNSTGPVTISTGGVFFAGNPTNISNGGTKNLGSAFACGNIAFSSNTILSTNGYALNTNGTFGFGRLDLSTSTVTCTGTLINSSLITLLSAGTSQINLTSASASLTASGLTGPYTFYNVAFTSTSSGTRTINGLCTFNNLAVTAPSSAGVTALTFNAQQTINGTLSTTGTAGNRRVFFASATYGISVDLVVNSAPSLTDADFRGLYVRGTSAPISGTRIGNRGECRNITFDAPKTVYWNLGGGALRNWADNGWCASSGGTPSTDNFPLPQDTAVFDNSSGTPSPLQLNAAIPYVPTVNMSGRTSALTFSTSIATIVYGNWTNGSGVSFTGTGALTFSGGGTQTITSAGKTFTCPITVDTYGGTVQLADALTINSQNITINNGTFTTAGYAVSAAALSSSNTNIRTVNLGSSTVTLSTSGSALNFIATNFTFNAGTSQITFTGVPTIIGDGLTFYNVSLTFTGAGGVTPYVSGQNTFNNLSITPRSSNGIRFFDFHNNQTINGTLTCAGATPTRRVFLSSNTIRSPRTLTVNALSATDCDFRDIVIAGAAAGSSPTRAGDCGNNTGITFPAPKTVYWNLAGAQNWSAIGWCSSSGGTPDINQFPLAQDTAVFDNTGAAGTVTIDISWNIGTFDASNRTSAMTLSTSTNAPFIYGDWTFGTGVTSSSTSGAINFCKNGTQTITSNGVTFGSPIQVSVAKVQLADAIATSNTLSFVNQNAEFDAVSYNVTTSNFINGSVTNILRMGSGTWTLTGTAFVWNTSTASNIFAGTSTIVLSNTSTTARTFAGGGLYYNKLTIGGTTGTSTLTITGANTFGEIASTKTVAHTITLPSLTATTVGKWSVTGTLGNVVTVNSSTAASAFTLSIAGPANTGIDYLSVRDCTVSTTSPGEFYVGVNSTNVSGNTRVIFTATPAARTLYWVGGTGNWSSTTKWDTASGGGGGAAIPTSLDAVNFDTLSNATAYTATIDAGVTLARCASFTMAGPLTGNVTFAGTVGIAFHGSVSFAATGITRTYTGAMNWAGNSSYTFTTNGLTLNSNCTVTGIGATWTLGSALTTSATAITVAYGTFTTNNFALTVSQFLSNIDGIRTINLGSSTVTIFAATTPPTNTAVLTPAANLTFNAGTSQITFSNNSSGINSAGATFYNVSFTNTASLFVIITGANTFNNLSITGRTTVGISPVYFNANQTINGTLTVSAGTASAFRTLLASGTFGTTRTLTCAAVSLTDVDFQDITIAGAAAPASGTRLGDAKGNSGITFPAAKTVYWAVNTANWGATGAGSWAATSGGAAANTEFPLPQDTAYIPFATPTSGSTITVNANYNIGTLDMSNRNGSALVTLATGTFSSSHAVYGNWINGTGTTLSGTSSIVFAGRGAQTITSSGRTFTQTFAIETPGGSVTLQDALTLNQSFTTILTINKGTFDAATYNVTMAGTNATVNSGVTTSRTVAFGSGTWTVGGGLTFSGAGITITGTGTISMTNSNSKTFGVNGNNYAYTNITLNQGGAGALTISGNNTFKTITNTYSATGATSISLGGTTTTLTDPWTATGAAGRVLTVSGSGANLVYTGAGTAANVDYLSISSVRAYPLVDEWYAGANSTNGGSLGWYFVAAGGTVYAATITETGTGTDSISAGFLYLGTVSELATSSDAFAAASSLPGIISETGSASDVISAQSALGSAILESATLADTDLARLIARATVDETATGTDADFGRISFPTTISETATGTDTDAATRILRPQVSETATGAETVTSRYIARPNIAETATGTDAVSARAIFLAAIAESATITDLVSALKGVFAYIIESATGTETVAPRYIANPTISETSTGTETVTSRYIALPNIAETATGTETVSPQKTTRPSVAETATGTETVTPRYIAQPAIAESATGTEAITTRATFRGVISETALAQEIVQAFFTAAAQVSELATGTDQVSALRALAAAVAETATVTDSLSARAVFIGLLQEAATAQDAVNAPGSIYNILMQELATAQDAITANAAFQSSLAETATGTEVNNAAFIPLATISESATITDVASALQAFAASISETSAASDVVLVAPSIFNAIAVAAATAIDNFNPAGSIYNVTVPESATLSDSVIGAFLWNLIDDAQNVTWNLVNAAQPATWAHVEASQASDWNIIPITGVLGPTWPSSAAGGGTAILLNTQDSPAGLRYYALNRYNAWTVQRFPVVGSFGAVSYLNGQYFVYSSPGATPGSPLIRSTDGVNWTPVTTLPTSATQVTGMFANGSTIVAVYNGQTYVTTDNCATWTAGSAMPSALQGVVVGLNYGSGLYILCDGRRIFSSPDALTWTTRETITYSLGTSGYRGTVAWDGSRFAVVTRSSLNSQAPAFRTSTNGTTWTTFSPPSPISSQAVAVLWDGSQFVFVCGGAGSTPASFYSANSTLTTFTLLGSFPGFFYIPATLSHYLFGNFNGQYVMPGFASPNSGPFYTSPNFSTFNAVIPPLPTDAWGNIATDQTQTWGIIPQQ